tara:strand:- start:438 stop:797 length:360 start_codon:yes stop_codon:yes gene_type:complete
MRAKQVSSNPKQVRKVLESVGSRIGSVDFRRRKDGTLRHMTYKLGVHSPTFAPTPSKGQSERKHVIDQSNFQMTVFSCNDVLRDKNGTNVGRGQFRTIPLENVERICIDGVKYEVGHRH